MHAEDSVYALLTDGTTIEIRPARPDDFDAVRDMHAKMSPENLYLRFFSMSRIAAEQEARRVCREPAPDHAALLAVLDGQVVGCGSYELAGDGSVGGGRHGGRRRHAQPRCRHAAAGAPGLAGPRPGGPRFVAETLTENAPMLQVFADAGLRAHRALVDGVYEFTSRCRPTRAMPTWHLP